MLLALLTNLKIYSQKIVSDNKGDKTICFSVPQGKYLLKKVAQLEKCDTLRSVCENQLKDSRNLVKDKNIIIDKIMELSDNQNVMLKLKEGQLDKAKSDLEVVKKENITNYYHFRCKCENNSNKTIELMNLIIKYIYF